MSGQTRPEEISDVVRFQVSVVRALCILLCDVAQYDRSGPAVSSVSVVCLDCKFFPKLRPNDLGLQYSEKCCFLLKIFWGNVW